MRVHIQNGQIWQEDRFCARDLILEDEKIVYAGSAVAPQAGDTVISAAGKYIVPGAIDCHAHVTMIGGSHHMATFFAENECELAL